MSEPNMPQSVQPRYTGGQIAMLVIGAIMLIPGACSLLFLIGMASDLARGDPIVQAIAGVWIVCFFISAAGVALIYVARKDRRAAANMPAPDGNPPP
jgi:hypothetical protein